MLYVSTDWFGHYEFTTSGFGTPCLHSVSSAAFTDAPLRI